MISRTLGPRKSKQKMAAALWNERQYHHVEVVLEVAETMAIEIAVKTVSMKDSHTKHGGILVDKYLKQNPF